MPQFGPVPTVRTKKQHFNTTATQRNKPHPGPLLTGNLDLYLHARKNVSFQRPRTFCVPPIEEMTKRERPRAIVLQVPATCCALDPVIAARSYRFFFQAGMQNATGKQEARVGTFCAGNKRIRRNEN